jgi:hypothetical protein
VLLLYVVHSQGRTNTSKQDRENVVSNKSRPAETGTTDDLQALCKKDDVIKALD